MPDRPSPQKTEARAVELHTSNPAGSPRVRDTTPPGGPRLSRAWTRNAPIPPARGGTS